jgi:hypothetical protein
MSLNDGRRDKILVLGNAAEAVNEVGKLLTSLLS